MPPRLKKVKVRMKEEIKTLLVLITNAETYEPVPGRITGNLKPKVRKLGETMSTHDIMYDLSEAELASLLGRPCDQGKWASTGPITITGSHQDVQLPDEDATKKTRRRALEKFSTRVMEQLVRLLSFNDIASMLQVSHATRSCVQATDLWKDLRNNVGNVMDVFAGTKILDLHMPVDVHAVLLDESCVVCGWFGGFVNLLTLERCCSKCARESPYLWTLDWAKLCSAFAISDSAIRDLPTLRRLPGKEWNLTQPKLATFRRRILSLRQVKERALEVHGGQEELAKAYEVQNGATNVEQEANVEQRSVNRLHSLDLSEAASLPQGAEAFFLSGADGKGNGHASFPVLTETGGTADPGWFCSGCIARWKHLVDRDEEAFSDGAYGLDDASKAAYNAVDNERSMEEHAEHVRSCPGASELIETILQQTNEDDEVEPETVAVTPKKKKKKKKAPARSKSASTTKSSQGTKRKATDGEDDKEPPQLPATAKLEPDKTDTEDDKHPKKKRKINVGTKEKNWKSWMGDEGMFFR